MEENETRTLLGHSSLVSRLAYSKEGTLLASASADCTGRIWAVDHDHPVSQELKGHKYGISDICWHPDQAYVATAADDMKLAFWDVETGTKLRDFEGHTHFVYCCKVHPHGSVLISGSLDESVRLWDIRSGHCIRTIPAHADPVTELDCSRDGSLLATCSSDGLSRLWDFRTGRLLRTLLDSECSAPITALRFCPNSRYLLEATLQEDAVVRVWDWQRRDGVVVRRLRGHTNSVYSVPATWVYGAWAASASEDGTVVLWHINSGKMSTIDFNTVPERLAEAQSAASPQASAAGPAADAAPPAPPAADSHMADAPAEAADAAAAAAKEPAAAAAQERKPAAGGPTRAAGGGGKAVEKRPAAMPRPCAINTMSVHEGTQRIAVGQIGRPDHSITLAPFPKPSM
eukprot:jgi/Ulvmu1/9869/UM057_0023.1